MPDQLACGFELRGAFGQTETHRLVVEDGGAKAFALLGIVDGDIERAAGHAQALRGDADAPAFQAAQCDAIAFAFFANQVLSRDAAVVEVDLCGVAGVLPQLVFQARHHIARGVGGHEEGAHAFFACTLVGHGDDNGHVTILATRDELLDAVDDVAVAVFHRRRAQRRRIAAHMRLGQAERAQHFAARQRFEPLLLLLRVAKLHQDGVDGAVGHTDDGAGAAVTGRDLFEHQRQRHVVQARAAQLFGHADAISAQFGQALVHVFREVVFLVPLGGMGPQLALGKVTHGVTDHFLVGGQQHVGLSLSGHHGRLWPSWFKNAPRCFGSRCSSTWLRVWRRLLALCSGVRGACSPPMSVCTQPGWMASTVMPGCSACVQRTTMLRAALLTR